ncbi:MAG: hypothetical protein Q7S01_00655 [bacterium]|nr:hypothetical protein [bacterium]
MTLLAKLKNILTTAFYGAAFFLAQSHFASAQTTNPTFLKNPLRDEFGTIPLFIAGVLKVLVMVALPVIVLFFVLAGFKFISAQGNPSELTVARKNFMYVVIGALLILGAWVIATLIAGTVSELVAP